MARTKGVTTSSAASIAVLGIVGCTSFFLGSVVQSHFGSDRPRQRNEGQERERSRRSQRDILDLVNPRSTAPIEAPIEVRIEDPVHTEFYRKRPTRGREANKSDTYAPFSVDGANSSQYFDWAEFPPTEEAFDPTESGALTITYEKCVDSLKGRSNAKTLQRRIRWLHFPKCGTSFGAVIYGYVCQYDMSSFTAPPNATNPNANCTYCGRRGKHSTKPTIWDPHLRKLIPFEDARGQTGMKFCDWSVPVPRFPFTNHFPHKWDWVKHDFDDAAVALFRDPRRRAVSAWNNNKHSYGIGNFHNPIAKTLDARARINAMQSVFEFARYPAIQSCQTKMMLGEYCGEYLNITRDMMKEAIRRVLNLEFVGLTDAFNASVCLWHHQFGGTPEPWMFRSVGGVRSSESLFEQEQQAKEKKVKEKEPLPGGGARAHPSSWKRIPLSYDPLDYQVYETAKMLFVARLQKYGLWHPDYKALKVICRGRKGPSPPC